jgi:hypothetical protein
LLSRAKDAHGNVQPDKHDENYATYVIDLVLPMGMISRNALRLTGQT